MMEDRTMTEERTLTTADLAAAADPRSDARAQPRDELRDDTRQDLRDDAGEPLAALFAPEAAQEFRARWDDVQIGFVDDPRRAVRQADELVARVMKNLAETFAREHEQLDSVVGKTDSGSTESLRMALRRYRSFFQRLLSL